MAETIVFHVLMQRKDDSGNNSPLYPITTAVDVEFDPSINPNLSSSDKTLENLISKFGSMAFDNGSDVLRIGEEEEGDIPEEISEIDDNITSSSTTWSSNKINENLTFKQLGTLVTIGDSTSNNLSLENISFNELLIYAVVNNKRITQNITALKSEGTYIASYMRALNDYGSLTYVVTSNSIYISDVTLSGTSIGNYALSVFYR